MGISYADLQHGPIAVVDAKTPAIIMAADSGPTRDAAVDLARRGTGAGRPANPARAGAAPPRACTPAPHRPAPPDWPTPIRLLAPLRPRLHRVSSPRRRRTRA